MYNNLFIDIRYHVMLSIHVDRKFGEKPKNWHPYRQFNDRVRVEENVSPIWERRHLKHSEYQDTSGVKFPAATGISLFVEYLTFINLVRAQFAAVLYTVS